MAELDFEEIFRRRLERRVSYKKFGFDFEGERWFIIEQALPLSGRLLEVGSGWGFFLTGLAERGHQVTGIDVNAEDVAFAKWNLARSGLAPLVDLHIGSGESLPFAEHAFDAVFAVNVFHHLHNPLKVTDEMLRVLAPEGKLIISDFSEEGFEIAQRIHAAEGGDHLRHGIPFLDVKKHLIEKGLGVEHERTRCQETLIAYAP